MGEALRCERIPEDQFLEMREAVLSEWPTGRDIDLEEAVTYSLAIPLERNATHLLQKATAERRTLVGARGGHAVPEGHLEMLQHLHEKGGVDLLPTTIDSLTRSKRFAEADEAAEESRIKGRTMLNGFPIVSHGRDVCRKINEKLRAPVIIRSQGQDDRLLWEVALAGGFSGGVGSEISSFAAYSKEERLEDILPNYQYIDRLVGYYQERGIDIYRETQSLTMRGVLVPPSLFDACSVLCALFMASQGVKYIGVSSQTQAALRQDVASAHVLPRLARRYLDRGGFGDVAVFKSVNPWAGGYPLDEAQAYATICYSALVAALSGSVLIYCKGTEEPYGAASKENNAAGARAMKLTLSLMSPYREIELAGLDEEMELIEMESCAILDKVLELGDGDAVQGTIKAFDTGVLDAPFGPNLHIRDRIIPLRDSTGAVRYQEYGSLPLPPAAVEENHRRLSARIGNNGLEDDVKLLTQDIEQGVLYLLDRNR